MTAFSGPDRDQLRRDQRVFLRHSVYHPGQWALFCPCCGWNDRYSEHRWAVAGAHQHAVDEHAALRTHEGDTP